MSHQQQQTSQQAGQSPLSSDTGTSDRHAFALVETIEHRRFTEFCDACRRYGYIGLCYGSPGVGKTLSARSYSRWDKVKGSDRWNAGPADGPILDTVFYTPSVVNTPRRIDAEIQRARGTLRELAKQPYRDEPERRLEAIQRRDEQH